MLLQVASLTEIKVNNTPDSLAMFNGRAANQSVHQAIASLGCVFVFFPSECPAMCVCLLLYEENGIMDCEELIFPNHLCKFPGE